MGRRAQSGVVLAGWVAAAVPLGCSLMGLDDFDPAPCVDDSDCAAAEREYPAEGCAAYVCRAGLCVVEEGVERCNGVDDDCDGRIDDVPPRALTTLPSGEPPGAVAVATRDAGTAYAVLGGPIEHDDDYETALGFAIGAAVAEPQTVRYLSRGGAPCLKGGEPTHCDFAEVAVAARARELVYVTVNTDGAAAGQIRVGLADEQDPFTVRLGTPDAGTGAESNIEYGVDVFDAPAATGASRPVLDGCAVPPLGASRPAVSVLDMDAGGDGALAVWLASPSHPALEDVDCLPPLDSVPVEALGVFVREGDDGTLNGTDGGKPRVIGHTASQEPPAVLALPGKETYLVAFAAAGDARGIEIWRVARIGESLDFGLLFTIPDAGAGAVSLALGDSPAGDWDAGVVWTSGQGEGRGVRFSVLRTVLVAPTLDEPMVIPSSQVISVPQLLYRSEGFRTTEPQGGWYLLWTEARSSGVADSPMARIADGERDPSLKILTNGPLVATSVGYPVLYPGETSSAGFGFMTLSGAESRVRPIADWCEAPASD